jgi:hypothetical protein
VLFVEELAHHVQLQMVGVSDLLRFAEKVAEIVLFVEELAHQIKLQMVDVSDLQQMVDVSDLHLRFTYMSQIYRSNLSS